MDGRREDHTRERTDDQGELETLSWSVEASEERLRLDAFVRRRMPHLSLRIVRSLFRHGGCRVNGRAAKKGRILYTDDVVSFEAHEGYFLRFPPPKILDIPILYEDDELLFLDKPAGVPTHAFSGRDHQTVANFVMAVRPSLVGVGWGRWEPGLVHRLDTDTSGVLLLAKSPEAFGYLRRKFKRRRVRKVYWALVRGGPPSCERIESSLAHDPRDPRKMVVVRSEAREGLPKRVWPALTRVVPLVSGNGYSLLEATIETGVTHQIRVHLAGIGCPIVGDALYGHGKDNLVPRCFLHARSLAVPHPRTERMISVESPLPRELAAVLAEAGINLPRSP